MSEADVSQADVLQRLQFALDAGDAAEKFACLVDGHAQNFGDVFPLVVNFEGLTIVPLTVAHFAGNVDVGQKLHFNTQDTVPPAGLTASPFDVEGESSRFVASHFCFWHRSEKRADVGEHIGVCGGVGTRCATDGRLVDVDHFV